MIYLWKAGDNVYIAAELEMAVWDGYEDAPNMEVTEEQFYAAGGYARVIGGEIVLGKTAQERADETALARIAEIDEQFKIIEGKMIRPMLAYTMGAGTPEDAGKLAALEEEINTLRAERQQLAVSLGVFVEVKA